MHEPVLATARLLLRPLTEADAALVLTLLTDPDFLAFVGDRGVHTLDDALIYLRRPPTAGASGPAVPDGVQMYAVVVRGGTQPIGMCGLVRRPGLADVDIGFAFLPAARGFGYARESAAAVLEYARTTLRLSRVVAIVAEANTASRAVLAHLQMREERTIDLDGPLLLYGMNFTGHVEPVSAQVVIPPQGVRTASAGSRRHRH